MEHHSPLLWKLPLIIFGIALAIFLLLFIRYQRKPVIHSIDRLTAVSSDRIEVTGQFFGKETEGAKLIIGGQPLTSTGIINWHEDTVVARIPRITGTVLVKVKNRSGISNGVILGSAQRFPQIEYGSWLPGYPFIESIEPGSGAPGSLITLRGKGFGARKGVSRVWINRDDTSNPLIHEKPDTDLYTEITSFDLWMDSTISFWIPASAASGSIYINKGNRYSNPVHIEITPGPGFIEYGEKIRWSLRQEVEITGIGSFPGNILYLNLPGPVPSGGGKTETTVIDANTHPMNEWRGRNGYLDIYQLNELVSGETRMISRHIVIETASVTASVNNAIQPYDPDHPELLSSLGQDEWIRPDLTTRILPRIVRSNQNEWEKSQSIYNYVIKLLEWTDQPQGHGIADYLSSNLADSRGYSILFCSLSRAAEIPARPIGGIIVDEENNSRKWWWAEFWIEGLGWIAVDPALADIQTENDTEDDTFGKLDERHIAFSKGRLESEPLQPNPVLKKPQNAYSWQRIWEESSGNLHSYTSKWFVPRVVRVYR